MNEPSDPGQLRMWTIGDYPVIARHLHPISIETVAALDIKPGDRVLDVGVGNGNAAIEAARRGASVTESSLAAGRGSTSGEPCRATTA